MLEAGGVDGGGDAGQTFEKCGGGGVEVLVGDAEDATIADGGEVLPVALDDEFFEGDSIPCSTPGEEQDVRVGGGNLLWGGVRAGFANEASAGGGYEFGDPVLGVDEWLAPLLAVDERWVSGDGGGAGGFDGLGEVVDESLAGGRGGGDGGDEADVVVDIGEGVGGEGEDGQAGFEDCGQGFEAVGDAGEDEVGAGGVE